MTVDINSLRNRTVQSTQARKLLDAAQTKIAATDRQRGIKGYQEGRSDTFRVNPYVIQIKPGFNSRDFSTPDNQEALTELAVSIAQRGVLKALTVYVEDDKLFLSDGESRLLATLYAIEHLGASIESIPVVTEAKGLNDAERLASQVIHNSGKPFTPLELSGLVKRLLGYGWTHEKIATETNIPVAKQNHLLELASAPEAVRQMVAAGAVSVALAVKTVKADGAKAATEKLTKAVETAKSDGKSKVLPKNVDGAMSLKKLIVAAFKEALADASVTFIGKEFVNVDLGTVSMSVDVYNALRAELKLEGKPTLAEDRPTALHS